jgi:hypothetical protein
MARASAALAMPDAARRIADAVLAAANPPTGLEQRPGSGFRPVGGGER